MSSVIVLLSDFGLADPYVGQMKGVLQRLAPDVRIVDLSHGITPFRPEQAGFFLESSHDYFPETSVFVSVVDPGVGTARRVVCLEIFDQYFLAPDNGLLQKLVGKDEDMRAYDLTPTTGPQTLMRRVPGVDASSTFHGRDIFAPLAACLAQGESPQSLGQEIEPAHLVRIPNHTTEMEHNYLVTWVLHVDRFGNAVLDAPVEKWHAALAKWPDVYLSMPKPLHVHRAATYADLGGSTSVGLLAGSQGYLELAVNQGSAAELVGLSVGDKVVLAMSQP